MNPDLLSQLRDIHAAPVVPWWPPAPGWWILALLLLVLLFWVGRRMRMLHKARQRRKQMLGWIDFLNVTVDPLTEPQAWLSMLNRVFKVIALQAFPEQQCAAMSGSKWVEFLSQQIKDKKSAEALAVLANGPFDPKPEFDPDTMSALAKDWIRQYG